jgi:hypothetical protein
MKGKWLLKNVMYWPPTGQHICGENTEALQCGRWRLEKQITVENDDRKIMRG